MTRGVTAMIAHRSSAQIRIFRRRMRIQIRRSGADHGYPFHAEGHSTPGVVTENLLAINGIWSIVGYRTRDVYDKNILTKDGDPASGCRNCKTRDSVMWRNGCEAAPTKKDSKSSQPVMYQEGCTAKAGLNIYEL